MSALAEILGEELADAIKVALAAKAAEIAGAHLYTGTAAIKTFGITRASLGKVAPTLLPGRSKPLYSAAAITSFLSSRTKHP